MLSGYTAVSLHSLIVALVLSSPFAYAESPATNPQCITGRVDERVEISHVYDGDTVRLVDGRRVRLVGIDTPEIGRDGKPSEAYAEEARRILEAMLHGAGRVGLLYDRERKDRHGRLLAHLFLADGTNVQRRLLLSGLATALVVPPNGWGTSCYGAVEDAARSQRRGIWSLARYQPIDAAALTGRERGFRIVTGRVERVGESRNNIWLNLSRGMALRIEKGDLVYFKGISPRMLKGRQVEVRGWLQRRKGQMRMRIRHPAALSLLED